MIRCPYCGSSYVREDGAAPTASMICEAGACQKPFLALAGRHVFTYVVVTVHDAGEGHSLVMLHLPEDDQPLLSEEAMMLVPGAPRPRMMVPLLAAISKQHKLDDTTLEVFWELELYASRLDTHFD